MDSDNPMNWSSSKKSWVTFQICLMSKNTRQLVSSRVELTLASRCSFRRL